MKCNSLVANIHSIHGHAQRNVTQIVNVGMTPRNWITAALDRPLQSLTEPNTRTLIICDDARHIVEEVHIQSEGVTKESAGGTMAAFKTVTRPNVANVSIEKRAIQFGKRVNKLSVFAIATSFLVSRNRINLATATIRRPLRGSTGHGPARALTHYCTICGLRGRR